MRRRRVVLPAPLGPVISTSSPRATVKLTSAKTAVRPKDLVTCAMRTAAGGVAAPLVAGREAVVPLVAGLSTAATRSESVACTPLETTPRCPTLSPSRLAQRRPSNLGTSCESVWASPAEGPAHIGPAPRHELRERSAAVGGLHEVGHQVRRVGRTEAGDRIPTGRRRVAWDRLVGGRDQAGPLRAAERGAADVEPAGAAGRRTAEQPALAVGGKADEDQRAGAGAGLVGDVRNAAHRADGGAAGRQRVLVSRLAEHVAEAAAAERPADFGLARVRLALGGRIRVVSDARRGVGRVGAEIGAADAGHQRIAGRPLDGREGDEGSGLANRSLADVGGAGVTG